uniref:Tail tape measure n=1 Tax=Myoviridae sp. ctKFg29 TaxID=2827675 RepID=A0A8S5RXJ6_9CAUD|nr:MAG TPA: tail tape measure [Myoviridae sp. ctKFg29]
MATPGINTKIKLDGEREYKAALAEINGGLKVLKSELNLASEQFRDNAGSVEALTKKNDILERSILTQQEKIEKLKESLQYSAREYGESSEKTNGWKVALNNAEAELSKMQRELDQNTDAIKKMTPPLDKVKKALAETKEQGGGVKTAIANLKEEFSLNTDSAKGLGTALTDIAGKFGVQLPDGAAKAAEALNGINAGAALAVTGLGLLAAAIVKVEKQLISMTKESAAYADNILTLSLTTGQTTDQLQEFSYASELIDVSLDTLQGSLTKLTNNMQDTANGTGNAQAAFQQLGVSVTDAADGHLRSANDVFYDAIDALGDVTNATERDALAMDIFGRSAQDLNPLIVQGADTLREYAQEAHDMGYVLDNDALAALGAVDDAYQRLQKTQEGVKNQLSEQFAPYLTEFYEKITRLIKDGGQALKDSGLVDAFGMILESVGDLIVPTNELAEDSVPKLTQALRPLAEVMAGIADTIDFIRGLVAFNSNPIWSADKWKGLSQMGKAAGFGYSYGNGNHTQTLKEKWMQTDTNYATGANGYGEYFGNGKYYGNRDAYLYALWEEELNSGKPVGSFEAWKMQKGYNASGTDFWRGGRTLIGENGPEEVVLPRGSRILTAQETRQSGGGDIYYVTIEARTVKEFNDIARIARNKRRTDRMGVAKE